MEVFILLINASYAFLLFYYGRQWAIKVGLSDKPGGRKQHSEPTPLIGGLVIFIVFSISLVMSGYLTEYFALLTACTILMTMGVCDDYRPLNAWFKFAIQMLVACFIVIFGKAEVTHLGYLWGENSLPLFWLSIPFSVMCFVLFMNGLNMIDGLDGLSGGLMTIILFVLMLVCLMNDGGQPYLFALSFAISPIVVFLFFNARYLGNTKASVFMGDAGTLTLGLILGWFAIKIAQNPSEIIAPTVIPWIMSIAVIDALAVYLVRALNGKNPFAPDRTHIHYRLMDAGFSAEKTVFIILGFTIVTALFAVLFDYFGGHELLLLLGWIILFFTHIWGAFHPQCYTYLGKRFA